MPGGLALRTGEVCACAGAATAPAAAATVTAAATKSRRDATGSCSAAGAGDEESVVSSVMIGSRGLIERGDTSLVQRGKADPERIPDGAAAKSPKRGNMPARRKRECRTMMRTSESGHWSAFRFY